MTVSSTTARQTYIGDGSLATYPYNFRILDAADLVLVKRNTTGAETLLAMTTDYTVTGAGGYSGGTFTLLAGVLPTGYTLAAFRELDLLQPTDLRNQGAYLAEVQERALDRLVMITQQLQDQLNRSIRLPDSEAGGDLLKLPTKEQRALHGLYFDADANPIAADPASAPVSAALQAVVAAATIAQARSLFGVSGSVSINPCDYPYLAVGDGTNDDTAEIQAAVDALPTNGGIIELPPGTFKISAAIVTNGKNVWIKGAGKLATTISQATVGANVHGINHTGATQYLLVSDLSIVTPADLTTDNGQCAIRADIGVNGAAVDNSECHVWNCRLSGFNFGVYVSGKNASASAKFSIASVRNCHIRHRGANASSISEAVNHHHCRLSMIEDNTLDALGFGDHSIYCYAPRQVIHRRNAMSNTAGEAVKILTNAAAGEMDPYSWQVDDNSFTGCMAACYMTLDGAYTLPLASFSRNTVITGGGGGTASYEVIFSTLSTGRFKNIVVDGDSFQDCQKGLVIFQAGGTGIIENASVDKIHAYNWSIASAGTYSAINDSGPGTLRTLSVQGYFDGNNNGRTGCGASVFGQITYRTSRQINCTTPNHIGNSVELGNRGVNVNAPGILHVDPNAGGGVGTPASLVETVLKTLTVPANTLARTNQGVRIKAWGTTAANANGKTIKLKYGGTTLVTNGVTAAPNGLSWEFEAIVFRTAASYIAYTAKGLVGAAMQNTNNSVSTSNDNTADQAIELTGQNGTANANDIVFGGMLVEYLPG